MTESKSNLQGSYLNSYSSTNPFSSIKMQHNIADIVHFLKKVKTWTLSICEISWSYVEQTLDNFIMNNNL